MRASRRLFFLTIMVLSNGIICLSGCGRDRETSNIVARIDNDYVITYDDLQKFVLDRLYHRMHRDHYQAYQQALTVMVTNQLKCKDFLERGLDKDNDLMQSIQRSINEELLVKYFNTQFLGKYTNEEFARKIYGIMGKKVIYQQILLYKPENASTFQLDSLKNIALAIKAEIDSGNDFKRLVARYSQQGGASNSDGYMPPLDWEQSLSNPIDGIIFNLDVGNVQVLDSHNSYRIVKVTDIEEIDLKPFAEIRDQIIIKLRKSYLDISLQEYDKAKNELIDIDALKWNDDTLDQLVSWSKIPNFYRDIYQDTLRNAISAGNNSTILTYPNGKVNLTEYLRLLNNILIPVDTKNIAKEDIKKFIIEAVQTDKIVQKAKELRLERDILDADQINPVLNNKIVSLYDHEVIEPQIPEPTPELLHKFYESQKDSLYYHLEKINVHVMIYPDMNKADEVMQMIKKGTPLEKISGRWLVKTFVRDRNGNIKLYRSEDKHYLGEAAFKLKLNETSGPIEFDDPEKGKQYAIIRCVNIRPERQLLFDDVRNSIAGDFEKFQREKTSGDVRDQLWSKYDVEIYEDVLMEKLASNN